MPTKKGPVRIYKLPRLLENSKDPIAIINEQYEVVFANTACCQWFAVEASELVGKRLKYAGISDDPSDRFNGICPSPKLFGSGAPRQTGVIRTVRDGREITKKAIFVRIQSEQDDHQAVLVIGSDHPTCPTESPPPSKDWHLILSQLMQADQLLFHAASLVGTSTRIRRVRRQVAVAAENLADCLIVGPEGSGREHVARTIFTERKIGNAQLVPIHCAIADGESIQNAIKNWVFDRRSNGSSDWLLLLDVDRLGVDAQCELLGYTQIPDFHMPILATSTHELLELSKTGRFSESLAMHLSIQTIVLSRLAERLDDLPLLAQAFVEELNRSSSNQVAQIAEETIATLQEYHWPRNIAELKQYVVSAHARCSGPTIQPEDLPEEFGFALSAHRIGYHELQRINLSEFLERIERELIMRALSQSDNNKTKAAQLLGISRARLLRRTNSLDIHLSLPEPDGMIDESEFKEAD